MKSTNKNEGRAIDINIVRSMIRSRIVNQYGSVAKFLEKDAEKFGGKSIRCYLYDSGSVNFKVLKELCEYLGIGEFSRNVVVVRKYEYFLKKSKK